MYSFFAKNGEILYVGKAKNLKKRVQSYTRYSLLSPRIKKLVSTAEKLEYQVLDSELEALLVEAELVRAHQPFFNVQLKDDKSPIYLAITNEKFPRILKKRKTDLLGIKKIKTGEKIKTVLGPFASSQKLNEVLKIARKIFPWCQKPTGDRPCFYYHLDQCPGACIEEVSSQDYAENINDLIDFLRGKKKVVLKNLEQRMRVLAKQEKFEEAQILKEKIAAIREVTSKQYRLEPNLVLPGLGQSQKELALVELKKILESFISLPRTYELERIEGYDVSNIQGKNAAVSMVTFTNGQPDKTEYKLFNIKTLDTPNDYHMMGEALTRRQNHPEWGRPSLIVVDGGKGQVRAVLKNWHWDVPIVGLVKNPDRLVIPLKEEKINWEVVKLDKNHPSLKLLQQIRDESHRFAKKQWGRRQLKKMLK